MKKLADNLSRFIYPLLPRGGQAEPEPSRLSKARAKAEANLESECDASCEWSAAWTLSAD
jgi:hypothetical protein